MLPSNLTMFIDQKYYSWIPEIPPRWLVCGKVRLGRGPQVVHGRTFARINRVSVGPREDPAQN